MKKTYAIGILIILIILFVFVNLYFFRILDSNRKDQTCLDTTKNPDKIRDDYFMVQYKTTLSESEIANHILKMGFNYSSIKITNDYYLIFMNNTKIQRENPGYYVGKATDAEFAKFSEFLLSHSPLITLAIRNPKGVMAMKVEFQRNITEKISRPILDELIFEYGNDEIWSKTPSQYYFNERQSWAHIHIPEGSNITEVEGYCQFLMEKEVIGAELVGDIVYAS